jgi:hypothetical protein
LKGTFFALEYCNGRQENFKFPQGICEEFFKFANLILKIPNELGTQKRNASRSLPVRGNFFQCRVFAMKSVQNLKSFWRSSQNYFVLALFSSLYS